jgi:UDP-N-acetylglucosamine--N-acetylmuramyl-(pentapeptide) pyrophosphoryl-undecaprenol N-acetylglucosamine transferase
VISRAGAGSISEFCLLEKPVILVPSPNVAEDHQTKNAQALTTKNAAVMVSDSQASAQLFDIALNLLKDEEKLRQLSENIAKMALRDSAEKIVGEIENVLLKRFKNSKVQKFKGSKVQRFKNP